MSFILKAVRPANLQNWIAVNSAPQLKGTARESWRAYLAANSGVGQSLRDLEMSFLAGQAASGATLLDRWGAYLTAQAGSTVDEKARNLYK